MRETQVQSLGWEDPLEKEMATHSSTLAWRIPWREEPGRLLVHGVAKSQTRLSDFTFTFMIKEGFPGGASGKEPACQCVRCKRGGFNPWVGKIAWRRAWHSSILAWRIPWTEEPGGLQSTGSQRVGHD